MSREALVVTLLFLLPGFFGTSVFRFFIRDDRHPPTAFELTTASLLFSVLGIAVLTPIPATRNLVSYVWDSSELSEVAIGGVVLQIVCSALIAFASAKLLRRFYGGLEGGPLGYRRSWDEFLFKYAGQNRYVEVYTDDFRYYGTLKAMDSPRVSRDIILQDPAIYVEEINNYFRTGMKYLLIKGEMVKYIEFSHANPLDPDDKPLPDRGPLPTNPVGGKEEGDDQPTK